MTKTAGNVRIGATGELFKAPLATAAPTDTTTALDNAFAGLGYISEDGVQQTIDRTTDTIKAWGGDTVRTITTEHDLSYTLAFLETNDAVLKVYYADPDATVEAYKITSAASERAAWVLEYIDGDWLTRVYLTDAQVTDTGDVTLVTDEAISYEVTLTAYPDADGVKAYIYSALAV